MKKLTSLYLLVVSSVAVLSVSGCGGGGGGGSSSQRSLIPLTTSDIHVYEPGDMLTTTWTMRDTATGETVVGVITITVGDTVQNPYGVDCRSVVYEGTLTGSGGSVAFSTRSLFYQDADNSLYDCGEYDETSGAYIFITDTAASPNGVFLTTRSPMQLGDSTSGVVVYEDGSWADCTQTVQAKENISVPLGYYESYKVAESCVLSDGTTFVNTAWYVPAISSIKESGMLDGFSVDVVVESTNY